jgi:hypothetical protein
LTIKKVSIERQVEQVTDGTDYKGYLKFAGIQLDFELKFSVHIKHLDDTELVIKSLEDIMRVFQISITRDGEKIEINDDEYGFFYALLVEHTIGFYSHSQTRDTNEGLVGKIMQGQGLFSKSAATISITGTVTAELNTDIEEMMSQPKFGCVFAK